VAKTLKETPITTRNARARLPAGLHWRGIDPETHLGYRKGKRGGGCVSAKSSSTAISMSSS
jgi:hypothetical protein